MSGAGAKAKTLEDYLASADPALWTQTKPANPGIDGCVRPILLAESLLARLRCLRSR